MWQSTKLVLFTSKRIPGTPRNCWQVSLASTCHDNVGGNVYDILMISLCGPSVTNYENHSTKYITIELKKCSWFGMVASVCLDTILCTKKCLACSIMRTFSSLVSNKCSVLWINCVISFILMVKIVKTMVFWVVTLCSLWRRYCLFRWTCRLQERCSVKGMIGGEVNRKCQDTPFSLLFCHIFFPSFYLPYQAVFLLPIPWLWLTFSLATLLYKQATSSPSSLQCHLGPNLFTYLSKPLSTIWKISL